MNSPIHNIFVIFKDILTVIFCSILLVVMLELGARFFYNEYDTAGCYQEHNVLGYIPKANCQRKAKGFEGKGYTHHFNEYGYISKHPCTEKRLGTLRIVGLGDSFTEGAMVNDDETYLSILENVLQRSISRKLEIFNLGVSGYDLDQYMQRTPEALRLKPDILIVGILPNDFFMDLSLEAINKQQEAIKYLGAGKAMEAKNDFLKNQSFLERLRAYVQRSCFFSFLLHYAYLNPNIYTAIYLRRGIDLGYLSTTFSPFWKNQMINVEKLIGEIDNSAKAKGADLCVVYIPQRVQAALLSVAYDKKVISPFILGDKLKEICQRLNIF